MFDFFFRAFNEKVSLTPEEEELIKTFLIPKKLRKRHYLLQEGDVCKTIAFVEKGALKKYSVDENGGEQIMQFAVEGWIVSDLYSFLTGEPATYNIDAIEDSELVLISKQGHEDLLATLPKYETYIRLQITGAYIALQKRLTSVFNLSPEERYNNLTRDSPDMIQRFPQHMIAAHMGLTPETLSRIRRKIKNEKN